MINNNKILGKFILDVLKYDIEQIDSIVTLLNDTGGIGWRECWDKDFEKNEVIMALKELARSGYVKLLFYNTEIRALDDVCALDLFEILDSLDDLTEDLWFVLTDEGRALLKAWSPPRTE